METTMVNGYAYGPIQTISVGGSPFTFTNPESVRIWVLISGGTVTDISMSSDLIGLVSLALLGGGFPLNPGHSIKVTHLLAPTMKYWPL